MADHRTSAVADGLRGGPGDGSGDNGAGSARTRSTTSAPTSSVQVVTSFGRRVVSDLVPRHRTPGRLDHHLDEAAAWLGRAQDATPDGGVSYGWSLRGGWKPSYRETSGYIVPTFFDLDVVRPGAGWRRRALRAARWLLEVQNDDGSFANPRYGPDGIVFDTGQVLFGLVRAFNETHDEAFLHGAGRAGRWLVEVADSDRLWTRNEHMGTRHVYNARTAWALLMLHVTAPDEAYAAVARANLDWAVREQRDGYFRHCAFTPGAPPYTHTIAYTVRGLLESGLLLDEPRYLDAASATASALSSHVRSDGFFPGRVDEAGRARAGYCCLTGNCQMAIVWGKLDAISPDVRWREASTRVLDYVMARQDVTTRDLGVRGAVAESFPIWGGYAPLSYPNWATKFLVDALLLRQGAES